MSSKKNPAPAKKPLRTNFKPGESFTAPVLLRAHKSSIDVMWPNRQLAFVLVHDELMRFKHLPDFREAISKKGKAVKAEMTFTYLTDEEESSAAPAPEVIPMTKQEPCGALDELLGGSPQGKAP